MTSGWCSLKAAIVFSIGFLCAAVPESAKMRAFRDWTRKQVPADIRHCLKIGVALAVAILGIYLAIGLITVIVWSVRNHAAVVSLFELSGMETGSRILTTVAMLDLATQRHALGCFLALRRRIRHR